MFLAGAPVVAVSAGHWAYRAAASQWRDQRSWREVTAVVLQAAPVEPGYYDTSGSWTLARWTSPAGHTRGGVISVPTGTRAGSRVQIWVDGSGRWAGPPVSRRAVWLRGAVAIVVAPVLFAAVLAGVASFARWLLDRRRLAGWEADWNSVGPQLSRQFRARW